MKIIRCSRRPPAGEWLSDSKSDTFEMLQKCGFASAAEVRNALAPVPAIPVVESRKDVCGGYDLRGRTHGYCLQAAARCRISRDYNG